MFKSTRNFDMSQFGWEGCKFTFNALTWGEARDLDKARKQWSNGLTDEETEKAANQIVDILKDKFVSGQAIDDKGTKVDVTKDEFENIPFDVFLKLVAWVTSGEVDEAFLAH